MEDTRNTYDDLVNAPHLDDVAEELQRHWEEEYHTWESVEEMDLTVGDKLSDKVADLGGSWLFIGSFCLFIALWVAAGFFGISFDRYPFIFLNLLLSLVAALQAPIIMMSQRRQDDRDRARAKLDFELSRKAEMEIRELKHQNTQLMKVCVSLLRDQRSGQSDRTHPPSR